MNYLIIGYGNIGHKRKEVLGKKCLATIDPNPHSGADYLNISQVPEKLIKGCHSVIVTIPRYEKITATEYWLKNGKNVLVEKPLIINGSEEKRLAKVAHQNNVICYTAYNYRFEPHILKIKQLLDKGILGKLYNARMVYGFGNVRELMGTWREVGAGAFEEVAPHLIDFTNFLFGYNINRIKALSLRNTEAQTYDHCLLTTDDLKVLMEASWIIWKNAFSIEIFGEKGSLHMNGLCKWGDSELIIRTRIFPSGVPKEKRFLAKGPPDPTWAADLKYFEKMAKEKKTSFKSDLAISKTMVRILQQYFPELSKKEAYELLRGKG